MYCNVTLFSHTAPLQEVERLERDNPLQPSNPFGETDDYNQSSGTAAEVSTYQQGQM